MTLAKQIALTLSLAATMTGVAVWFFSFTAVLWEEYGLRWIGDDDGTWLALPLGAAAGLAIWIPNRRRAWIHVAGPASIALLALGIVWALARTTPEGMQGLGVAIGKLLALGLAVVLVATGAVSLVVAGVAVFVLRLRERAGRNAARGPEARSRSEKPR